MERKNMKTHTKLYLLALSAAAVSLIVPTASGQAFDSVEALKNRSIAASPRAREVFPWLARSETELSPCEKAGTTSKSSLAEVKSNRALAASPRMKEIFPELARPSVFADESTAATWTGINPLTEVTRNRALAASPRMHELFPELTRGAEKTIEIAPLK